MIRTTCSSCGFDISVPARHGHVVVGPGADIVVIPCPTCGAPVTHPVTGELRAALERLGARVLASPAQTPHPEKVEDPDAPAFTIDDLIGLHEALECPGWFAELLALDAS